MSESFPITLDMPEAVSPTVGQRVALCGFAPSWREAPFSDEKVQVWGLNELYTHLPEYDDGRPRWNEWYELHDEDSLGITHRAVNQDDDEVARHKQWLSQDHGDRIIWMQPRFCDGRFPNARPFPLERIQRTLSRFTRQPAWTYLTSTIAYALAEAITRGRDEQLRIVDESAVTWLGIYGVELIGQGEYRHQRPCAELLIGLAYGIGIDVHIPESSALMKADHLYGYETAPINRGPMSQDRLYARRAKLQQKADQLLKDLHRVKGATLEVENWITVVEGAARGVQELPDEFVDRRPQLKPD